TGIGKATIYYHFPDKVSIVMALLQEMQSGMHKTLEVIRRETDPRSRIHVAAVVSVDFLFDSADFVQIARREVPNVREVMQAKIQKFFQEYIILLAESIQQGVDQGIFRPVDARQTARILLNMIQGTFAMAYLGGGKPSSSEAAARALLDVFFKGIEIR
ncbi:MAG: TetR/AcrR family transcriptional regulator, partial [Leptolinea sp.]|nr:TetR/AcrR family transcriptional regulator [Leptolinea sp.]